MPADPKKAVISTARRDSRGHPGQYRRCIHASMLSSFRNRSLPSPELRVSRDALFLNAACFRGRIEFSRIRSYETVDGFEAGFRSLSEGDVARVRPAQAHADRSTPLS
jgi:hypothetical protein